MARSVNGGIDPTAVEVVFLDAGGVLLNPDWERASAMLARQGIYLVPRTLIDAEAIAKRRMDDPEVLLGRALPDPTGYLGFVVRAAGIEFADGALLAAAQEFEAEHQANNMWSQMPAEVPGALGRLRDAGYRLAVISNAESNVRDRLAGCGLDRFFEKLIISAEVGAEKPDAAIFWEALRQMGVEAEHALHVGDFYEIDVMGARGVGIPVVLLDATGLSADRDGPRVRTLTELADQLGASPQSGPEGT